MAADTPFLLSRDSQKTLVEYSKRAHEFLTSQSTSIREKLVEKDLIYMREENALQEQAKARQANRLGDSKKFKTW